MATVTSFPPNTDVERLYRISVELYHRMGDLGLLSRADRVVLLDGLLVRKMTKKPRHVTAAQQAIEVLGSLIPTGWYVRKEDPVTLRRGPEGTDSEPEPDIAVVRGSFRDYAERHPGPADIALIVEVADSSVAEDRAGLRRLAWAEVPCVWIVNLVGQSVEVCTRPTGPADDPGYEERTVFSAGELVPVTIGGQVCGHVAVENLLA